MQVIWILMLLHREQWDGLAPPGLVHRGMRSHCAVPSSGPAQKRQRWGSAHESRRLGLYQQKAIPGYQTSSASKSGEGWAGQRCSGLTPLPDSVTLCLSAALRKEDKIWPCSLGTSDNRSCSTKWHWHTLPAALSTGCGQGYSSMAVFLRYPPPHLRQQPCCGSSWTEEVAGTTGPFNLPFPWLAWRPCMMAAHHLWKGSRTSRAWPVTELVLEMLWQNGHWKTLTDSS